MAGEERQTEPSPSGIEMPTIRSGWDRTSWEFPDTNLDRAAAAHQKCCCASRIAGALL